MHPLTWTEIRTGASRSVHFTVGLFHLLWETEDPHRPNPKKESNISKAKKGSSGTSATRTKPQRQKKRFVPRSNLAGSNIEVCLKHPGSGVGSLSSPGNLITDYKRCWNEVHPLTWRAIRTGASRRVNFVKSHQLLIATLLILACPTTNNTGIRSVTEC